MLQTMVVLEYQLYLVILELRLSDLLISLMKIRKSSESKVAT